MGISVKQILNIIEKILKKKVPIKHGPRRMGDPSKLIADSAKAFEVLKWRPRISGIETIIESAVKWFELNNNNSAKK